MYKIGNVFRNSILNGNFEMALFFPATEPLVNTKALVLLRVSVLFLLSCCVVIWNVLYPDRHSERLFLACHSELWRRIFLHYRNVKCAARNFSRVRAAHFTMTE